MPIVDVHTHYYPPLFMELLRSRDKIPYVRSFPDNPAAGDRLVILPAEDTASTSRGRPIGPEYYDISKKIEFMNKHDIDISVISLANPWLDFVDASEAAEMALKINDNMESICADHAGRLFAFGTLPLSGSIDNIVVETDRLHSLRHMRGVIIGTSGCGQGLDDPKLDPVFKALEKNEQMIFLHPHYGLPTSLYGPQAEEYGHVLPLALGFPLETTIAITRMILGGVFDRFPSLKILVAHSGGTLPFLAGRIESCISHDAHLKHAGKVEGRKSVFEILKQNIYLDAVIYNKIGLGAAIEASGADRLMFGTDHPFFPPLEDEGETWKSVTTNSQAVADVLGGTDRQADVLGNNAVRVLNLR